MVLIIGTSATFVIQERPTHTWTQNLKTALGPKPCKVNQQYQDTNVNQHVLADKATNNPNKKIFFIQKTIVQSYPICSVTLIQKSIKMRLAKKIPNKRLSQFISNQGQAQFAARRDTLIRTKYLFSKILYILYIQFHIHFVAT